MATLLREERRRSGAWLGDAGYEVFDATVGAGRRYAGHDLNVTAGEARVRFAPPAGVGGDLRFVVEWSYGPFGAAEFDLEVRDEPAADSPERVVASPLRRHAGGWFGWDDLDVVTVDAGSRPYRSVALRVVRGEADLVVDDAARALRGEYEPPEPGDVGELSFPVLWSYATGEREAAFYLEVTTGD